MIGGADGPTSIFVTSSVNWLLAAGAVIVICGIILFFVLRAKRN
jgi:Na+-transporting methylmalonyl-CoA/oxaloacetate decarboxylase beta subunit